MSKQVEEKASENSAIQTLVRLKVTDWQVKRILRYLETTHQVCADYWRSGPEGQRLRFDMATQGKLRTALIECFERGMFDDCEIHTHYRMSLGRDADGSRYLENADNVAGKHYLYFPDEEKAA